MRATSLRLTLAMAATSLSLWACDDGEPPPTDADGDGDGDGDVDSDVDGDVDGDGDADGDPGDSDGDGLPDEFEAALGDSSILNPALADTDGDGLGDGDEDPDGDGLTNLEELAAGRLTSIPAGPGPDPLGLDLLVELDVMEGRLPSEEILAEVISAYAEAPAWSAAGVPGVGVHFYLDEAAIGVVDLDGSFEGRHQLFAAHGPVTFADRGAPPIPYHKMVHLVVATRRTDDSFRGGDTVADSESGDPERTGVLIYWDALDALHPQCDGEDDPARPPITFVEALTSTITHELGHTLQLGHDTEANGGVNYYNIMSVPRSCDGAQMRFHGAGNHDEALGNTEAIMAPRFSVDAAALFRFDDILSVHTASFADGDDGYEM